MAPWGSGLDKYGLSLAGTLVPGGLGQQILKTMLRRYEALGGVCGVTAFKEDRKFAKHGVSCKGGKPPGAGGHRKEKPCLEHVQRQGQAHRGGRCGAAGGGRRGQADGVGEAERRPPRGERRQAKG